MNEKKVDFSIVFLFPWIKGSIAVDSRMVKVCTSNTILGIIPAGKDDQSVPLKNIGSVKVKTGYDLKPMLIGLILAFIGFSTLLGSPIFGLLLMLIGVGMFGGGIKTYFTINRAGSNYTISGACYSKKALISIKNDIEKALMDDADKTDIGMHIQAQAQANAEAIAQALNKN